MILAAGVGVRLHNGRPNGEELPKALLRFGGRSLLERHLAILRSAEVNDISIVVGYREETIRKELAEN
ncbi:MAG: NTP transferase domain-containing protein, partial [Hyphomicrobiales bacterium]|nr:NTP transferase domain-containing protein [Hyphomicrobiales bacterium]